MTTSRPRRILYGITKSNFGGAQRYVYDLATEAHSKGLDVAVLAGVGGILTEKLEAKGVEVIKFDALGRDISPLNDIRAFFYIMNVIHEWKPDVFHINSSKMGGVGGLAARIMRVPTIIFTSHGWAFNEPRPWWQKGIIRFLHWITIVLAHKTICVSEKTKWDVAGWPFTRKKLVVVKNGIESFELLPRGSARREFGIHEEDTILVGALGELHIIKGFDVLLLAWSEFIRGKQAHLIIVGEGEEREYLENMAQQLGISESVSFRGFLDNARSRLPAFDIFVIPSRSENLPYALLDSGMASSSVIATKVGGIPEVIENNISGILIPSEDPEALLLALERLAKNKKLRTKFGLNLHNTVKQKYSKKKMFTETFSLYL